jgi:ATP-dependent Clp protease protease subunit
MRTLTFLLLSAALLTGCSIRIQPKADHSPHLRTELDDPVLQQRRVFLVGHINNLSAAEVIRQLLHLDALSQQTIRLDLMTPGGELASVLAIVHTLQSLRSRVDTCALGECSSGGAMLLAAGTGERTAFRDSIIVIHGIATDGKPPARYRELTQDGYTRFWRQHARLPEAWLPIPQDKLFFLNAEEALDYGIIDRIVDRTSR